jgi:hypothetical protein
MNVLNRLFGQLTRGVVPFRRLKRQPVSPRAAARRGRPFRPGVESLEERQLLSTFFVTTAADNGNNANPTPGSLREAILLANNDVATDLILFNIPNVPGQSDVHTIKPPTALPTITQPLTISGYTQQGAASNTASDFDNASLKIVLDGSLLQNGENGLTISAGNSAVTGLVINHFPGYGVWLQNAGDDTIAGNFIGIDVFGKVPAGNGGGGISAFNAGFNNIGGPALGDRNVISGNGNGAGIFLDSDVNNVQNNYIGTDAFRVVGPANFHGILIQGSHNLIGGDSAAEGNVISGNFHDGIRISLATSAFNLVAGNRITFNQGNGIFTDNFAHDNTVGSFVAGEPLNDISFNQLDGVQFTDGTGNSVTGNNSISVNGGLGIELLAAANKQQTSPALTAAVVAGGQTTITGTLHSTPNTTFELRFWGNPSIDPAEGKVYLGAIAVTTDANGNASFTAKFNTALKAGDTVTATADSGSGTSEFSAPVTVTVPAPVPVPVPVHDVTPLLSVQRGKLRHRGGRYRQTITLHNDGAALAGPVYLVLDRLTRKVRLQKASGRTAQKAPLGDPYVSVDLGDNVLGTGETRTVTLSFRNPLGRKVRYSLRVLAGTGVP